VEGLDGVSVSRRRLTINPVVPTKHNGVYTCEVSTSRRSQGSERTPFTHTATHHPFILSVTDDHLPSLVVAPESTVVRVGDEASFQCQFEDGTTTEWYFHNQGPLTETGRFKLYDNGTFLVRGVTSSDEGDYKCVGVHPKRSLPVTYSASLKLAYMASGEEPSLEPGPEVGLNHVVGVGGTLRVVCLPPPAYPHPDIFWATTDFEELPDSGSIRVEDNMLVIEGATYDHAGNYTCTSSNLAATATTTLSLVVTKRPVVEMVTKTVQVLEDETTRLECRFDTAPPPFTVVTWTLDAQQVTVDDYRISVSGSGADGSVSILRLRWVRLEDAGKYACVVTTVGHPPVVTKPATLIVTERLKFSRVPDATRVEVGGNTSIPCKARGAVPPAITWQRVPTHQGQCTGSGTTCKTTAGKGGSAHLPENMASSGGSLEIYNAVLENTGDYMCVASSAQATINTTVTLLVIESAVLEWVTQGPVQVEEGETLVLECHARGNPPPAIHWDYNHATNAFDPSRVDIQGNGTLRVSGMRPEDGGIYGCTAGNMGGLVRAEITVDVAGSGSKVLGRTVGVAVGGAAAYIALVGAMLFYCRQRRQRLKNTNARRNGSGRVCGEAGEERERLMYCARPRGIGAAVTGTNSVNHTVNNTTNVNTRATAESPTENIEAPGTPAPLLGGHMETSNIMQSSLCASNIMQSSFGASSHLGLSQASTHTMGSTAPSPQPVLNPSTQAVPQTTEGRKASYIEPMQICREDIQVLLTLGHGEFGEVQLARIRSPTEQLDSEELPDPEKLVMVKVVTSRDESVLAEVCREASMFSGKGHARVVTTLALFTSPRPHLLVTSYTDWGDLKQFLLATRKDGPRPIGGLRPPPVSHSQCIDMIQQVAEGLEYLHGRRHTHKDIAARNCLITSTLQVKLSNPALTRDAYATEYCTFRNQVVPVRWLAPEALLEDEHSMKSSVYSWAWLAWEVLTQAALPHTALTHAQVIDGAERGDLQHCTPTGTPPDLANLLTACWQYSPRPRPAIHDVVATLRTMV
ncbi:unnamed protein product, partial [Meganyctiphanes norvegica]